MRRALLTGAVLLFLAAPASAKFDPSFSWTTIETQHFLVHYHQGGEETARKAAAIAEDVHARLVPRIKWEPKQKTRLVLVDAMDEANGMASPMPYNQMIIFLTQPLSEPGFGTVSHDDWLRLVITHEYAHVLQLDMVNGGLGGVFQTLFGRIYFPNMFQPVWMTEGLATYEETELTSGGRGRSPGAEMVLRMAVLEGPFPSLGQAAVFPDSWPAGQVPYLFGESFSRFIADRYGRDKLAEISTTYSGRGLPFLVDSTGRRVLKSTYGKLWREWKEELTIRFGMAAEKVKAAGLTASAPLTSRGHVNAAPAFSPDGKRIAYSTANNDEFPSIRIMDRDGGNDRALVENVFPRSASGDGLAWSADGSRLYFTRIEVQKNTNYYSDIYFYDVKKEKLRRLTRGLRARDPHPSPDGKRIVFVVNSLGRTRLAIADLPQDRRKQISPERVAYVTDWSSNQYASPRFSPDGSRIAVSVWQPGGNRDLWILDSAGTKLAELARDRALEGAPAWSSDGKHLYFSSDRTGIFNLHAYEVGTGKIFQITNVLGGAFTPAVSPDGQAIAFSSYSAKGHDIHTLVVDPSQWRVAAAYRDPYPRVEYADVPVDASTRPYSPLSTIYPRFWLPWFGYSSPSGVLVGGLTFGMDAVQRHQYFATGLYGPKNGRTWYEFDYFYDGFYPTFHIKASDTDITHSDLPADTSFTVIDYTERQKTYGLSMILPLIRTRSQHSLTIGYRWRELSALTSVAGFTTGFQPAEGILASGRAVYQYSNAQRYGFSISPEDGRTIELGYERLDRSLGSDYELHKYTADWSEFIGFPWKHHVLLARAFAGSSIGDVLPQRAFQLGGDTLGDIALSIDEQDVYLRGYPVNSFRGNKAALGSLEYRFPLWNLEAGWGSKPVFLRRMHGAVFFEAGNAWDGIFHKSDLKRSVGAEVRLDADLAYYLPVTFRVVVAAGLEEEGEAGVYFGLWIPVAL